MRATWMGLAVVVGVGALASPARAQDTGFSDPFFLYYGFYLPRQAALAAQPQPEDYVRATVARRQEVVQSERAGLYEPIPSIGLDELDPTRPFGMRSGSSRLSRVSPNGITHQNLRGTGPGGYYSSTRSYFPGIRTGRGGGARRAAPAGVSFTPRGGGSMGMMGMGSPTGGVPINTNFQSPVSGRR